MRMRSGPNGAGLSRKAIFAELDASLKRLGTDYIDLYQVHRWDYDTPIEETLEALHDAVRSGKVRYIGASSMHAWQFAKALYLADLNGWTRHRRDPVEPAGAGQADPGPGKRGLSPAQVALAWVMRNPVVTSPIVGVTKPAQLADAVAAVDVELDEDEAAYLEESFYKRQPVAGSR
jgi:aryl-alcohol dehydrogenase-like predicted oxidoreductase